MISKSRLELVALIVAIMIFGATSWSLSPPPSSLPRNHHTKNNENSSSSSPPSSSSSSSSSARSSRRRNLLSKSITTFVLSFPISPSFSRAEEEKKRQLTFQTLEDGVRIAEIQIGGGISSTKTVTVVQPNSKINIHLTGRLLGKNGWIFENSQVDEKEGPYRLQLGVGNVIPGLERGLVGMREGGKRRIVVPSAVGYLDKSLEPIPRDFGNRQRLYTTVMNRNRIDREKSQLGGNDLAGTVVFDVELLRIRN